MKVKALKKFETIKDLERGVIPKEGEVWETSEERAKFLLSHGVIEIVEEVKEKIDFENVNNIITTKEALKDIEPLDVNNAIERIEKSAKETVELEEKPKKKKKTSKK